MRSNRRPSSVVGTGSWVPWKATATAGDSARCRAASTASRPSTSSASAQGVRRDCTRAMACW